MSLCMYYWLRGGNVWLIPYMSSCIYVLVCVWHLGAEFRIQSILGRTCTIIFSSVISSRPSISRTKLKISNLLRRSYFYFGGSFSFMHDVVVSRKSEAYLGYLPFATGGSHFPERKCLSPQTAVFPIHRKINGIRWTEMLPSFLEVPEL